MSFPVSANYDLPADFTIEAWVHATGARTTSDVIASRWVSGNRIWLLAYDNVNKWAFAVNDSSLITYNSTIAYNTWYHIAVTRSGTTVTMWLNGVSVGTATSSYNFTSATQPLFIGRNGDSTDGSQDWLGYISNFRIVKGTALYTSNFTPPTAPLTAISGTQVLTCKSSTIIDKSTNNFTITNLVTSANYYVLKPKGRIAYLWFTYYKKDLLCLLSFINNKYVIYINFNLFLLYKLILILNNN